VPAIGHSRVAAATRRSRRGGSTSSSFSHGGSSFPIGRPSSDTQQVTRAAPTDRADDSFRLQTVADAACALATLRSGEQALGDGRVGRDADVLVPTMPMQSGVTAPLALGPALGESRAPRRCRLPSPPPRRAASRAVALVTPQSGAEESHGDGALLGEEAAVDERLSRNALVRPRRSQRARSWEAVGQRSDGSLVLKRKMM
jgi:hypothetical protein